MKKTIIATALLSVFATSAMAAKSNTKQLEKVIEKQEQTLAALEKRLTETEARLEATATQVETTSVNSSATTIGGYGELHYNNYIDNGKDSKVDFHRFVLFFGHEFTNKLRFFSEFEIEHSLAGEGKPGEVEIEQAYIEYDYSNKITAKAGLFLVPVGLINETHEPPAFYGVERNSVEKNIIPATWWEAGAAINYKAAPGLAIDAAITSGLNVSTANFDIRKGRQKVAEANADSLAYTGRVKYTAIPGLELAATLQYQEDITQGLGLDKADATLVQTHIVYSIEKFTVKALYAHWNIDGFEAKALGKDEQQGWYVEPSYKINETVGAFARYEEYDNTAGDNASSVEKVGTVGVNYYLHPQVVLKADIQKLAGNSDSKVYNLGVGYNF